MIYEGILYVPGLGGNLDLIFFQFSCQTLSGHGAAAGVVYTCRWKKGLYASQEAADGGQLSIIVKPGP